MRILRWITTTLWPDDPKRASAERYGAFQFRAGTSLSVLQAGLGEIAHSEGDLKIVDVKASREKDEITLALYFAGELED